MISLQYTHRPVAQQISDKAAAHLQNRASVLALLVALGSAVLFGWLKSFCCHFGGGRWSFWGAGCCRAMAVGTVAPLRLFNRASALFIGLGGVSQPEPMKVFFGSFCRLAL